MNDSGQRQNADGSTTIRHMPSHEQMRAIIRDFEPIVIDEMNAAQAYKFMEDTEDKIRAARMLELNLNQLRIIANELERRPAPNIFAQRIYALMPAQAEPGLYGDILAILEDQYAHLNNRQRDAILAMTSRIMAAGDGGDNTMTEFDATEYIRGQGWSIADMLGWCQLDDERDLRARLDFNPDTGNEWEPGV